MYPTGAFNQGQMGFPFVNQQPSASLFPQQYGGVGGYNPQGAPPFQQGAPPRGQSLPASVRRYPQQGGPYAPGPPSSSSRQQQGYQQTPPGYEQHSRGSKSKKHHKRRSVSPNGVVEQGLYSDQEQRRKERRNTSEDPNEQQQNPAKSSEDRSRSASPALGGRSKQEGTIGEQQQAGDNVTGGAQAGTDGLEDKEAGEGEKRKSGSKKKKHHRRDRYEAYNIPPQGVGLEPFGTNPYQLPFAVPQYQQQQPGVYGAEFQGELPPHMKVHRQPLYNGYNQAYEESIRRGDVYRKQAKRSARLPPEVKQQLLPHEDDPHNQQQQQQQQQQPQQQIFPFGAGPQFPQQQGPQQPFGIRPPFNPFQQFGAPQPPQGFYGGNLGGGPAPFGGLPPWANVGGPAEQEIQRLRSHIHSLEGELHKLQRKLTKATLNNQDPTGQSGRSHEEGGGRSHREHRRRSHDRSKREGGGSPRQTPVIVELNNTTGEATRETSSKKHRRRTGSGTSTQPGQNVAQQDLASVQRSGAAQVTGNETISSAGFPRRPSPQLQRSNSRERLRSGGNQISDSEDRQNQQLSSKRQPNQREETAAQLAHAAAAHVNGRYGTSAVGGGAPVQQQQQPQSQPQQQQQQQVPAPPPPPPPISQAPRQQVPLQQQQQQYLYQQGVARPPQQQQIRGPIPGFPSAGNVRYPGDPYQQQQQQQQQQQYNVGPNPNYNQSNNNELFDDSDEQRQQEEQSRSAEKILDAFERFYVNRGKPTTAPMKVKYIPEDVNTNSRRSSRHRQLNTNNNNRRTSLSKRSNSASSSSKSNWSSSPVSSRRSLYDNNQHAQRKAVSVSTGPFM